LYNKLQKIMHSKQLLNKNITGGIGEDA